MSEARYLVDTHVLLWDLNDDARLSSTHLELMAGDHIKHLSVASIWEIAIKVGRGKLVVPPHFLQSIEESELIILPVLPQHAYAVSDLPHHHRDPFDRMLVAQAQIEGLTIMTMDRHIRLYDVAIA